MGGPAGVCEIVPSHYTALAGLGRNPERFYDRSLPRVLVVHTVLKRCVSL